MICSVQSAILLALGISCATFSTLDGFKEPDVSVSPRLESANWLPTSYDQAVRDLTNVEFENSAPPSANDDSTTVLDKYQRSFCKLIPIVHLLHLPGCQAKAIASFACAGSCTSYVQVSL